MVLHATREVFFFLSALLACLGQLAQPRSLLAFWVRRLGVVLVPYLAWTLIYFCYTLASGSAHRPAGATLAHDLLNGYYQLYFLVVLFQVYLVLPGVLWLLRRCRGRHGVLFGASLALQLAMMTVSHYFSWRTGAPHALRAVDLGVITPRYVTGYQLYVVAGALGAWHFDALQGFVERRSGLVLAGMAVVGAVAEGYYAFGLVIGQTPGHASDLFQPVAALWFLAASAGLWAAGWRWARRAAARDPGPGARAVRWGSDASGGVYLAHVLVLQLLFSGLAAAGLTARGHWWAASLVLFAATVCGTGLLVAALLRTPLRWALTGPDRTRQRARLPAYPPVPAVPDEAMASVTASAMAR
jgi:surface polysaccharide O-acyltransferase-like enzyme